LEEKDMHNLIVVEGIPGTGKSTMSQFIFEQMKKNDIQATWLHEGLDDHFIWNELDKFFNEDGYIEVEDFDCYSDTLIKRFKEMERVVRNNDQVFILDGNVFAGYTNVYFKSDSGDEAILKYYRLLEEAILPLNPLLIYLDTDRVREHTIETWENRAMWGKKVVTEAYGKIPHIKRGGYTGDDILYEYVNHLHDLDLKYYEILSFDKLKFNIDKREYHIYQQEVLKHLNLSRIQHDEDDSDLNRYVGIYDNDRDKKNMFVKIQDGNLVCDWGQMNMALNYVEANTYNLRSYPIYLKFIEVDGKIAGIETYGQQCFRRAGCSFNRVEATKYEIRK